MQIQKQMKRAHSASVVISLIVNAVLLVALLFFLTMDSENPEVNYQVKVIEPTEQETIEDLEEEIIPEEEVPDQDLSDLASMEFSSDFMSDISSEMEAVDQVVTPTVSPVSLASLVSSVSMGGDGEGPAVGATSFMGQKASGSRIAFIIDYSKSMKPDQLGVMKSELTAAISKIGDSAMVSVLFFSGPVWRPDQDGGSQKQYWNNNGHHEYMLKDDGVAPEPKYFAANRGNVEAVKRMIYETRTTGGTDWFNPFYYTLALNPRPNVIFFMTDGSTSKTSIDRTMELVKGVPRGSVQINTVALGLSEKQAEPLETIAEMTGGDFRLFSSKEIRDAYNALPPPPENFSDRPLRYLSDAEVMTRGNGPARRTRQAPVKDDSIVEFEIL